jgi:hypothetical protein
MAKKLNHSNPLRAPDGLAFPLPSIFRLLIHGILTVGDSNSSRLSWNVQETH